MGPRSHDRGEELGSNFPPPSKARKMNQISTPRWTYKYSIRGSLTYFFVSASNTDFARDLGIVNC